MYLQDSLSQLSRIGVGSVLGDIMRGEGGGMTALKTMTATRRRVRGKMVTHV